MAIGITPKYQEEIPLHALTAQEFLTIATEAVARLNWSIHYQSASGFIAKSSTSAINSSSEIKLIIEEQTATISSESTGGEMIDFNKNKKNVQAFLAAFDTVQAEISPDELSVKSQELHNSLDLSAADLLKVPAESATQKVKNFFSLFIPKRDFFFTPILVNLNILIFILMAIGGADIFSPSSEILINWGANFRPLISIGQYWRLITNCFLHIGILHLLFNMYALLYVGVLLEPMLGKSKFIAAYLLTGIGASLASTWWHEQTISAGASGAIFGLYGVFLALLTTDLIEKETRKELLTSIGIFVVYNLAYGMKGGIDNAAHIGGLVSGLVIGYALTPSLRNPEKPSLGIVSIAALCILMLFSSFGVIKSIPNTESLTTYDKRFERFRTLETMALDVYTLKADAKKEDVLYEIRDRGIYYWNENISLLDSLEQLNLPPFVRERDKTLKEYCNLRIKAYELMYKAVDENSHKYDADIAKINKQIESMLKSFE
ncbi:rhomboid family intramembrane serine protease [Pedobacter sp. SG908]|uniref:rhomboid family intramembrane serine protease n=1 Tax=Pedobacter sp. SG908 TaxID=2587135 RepID=UPI00141EF3AD|nr:rhomboid family intramembrane serine protease [Pedobacter sp. SG908]NII82072.1 rhomboid protease GluP [Pedobacter sp. SG908]